MIKFNEVTWYSKLATIIFFIGIWPVLTFYIGIQYEKALQISLNETTLEVTPVRTEEISQTESVASTSLPNDTLESTTTRDSQLEGVVREDVQFTNPQPLKTKYISATDWPPAVSLTVGEFVCTEGEELVPTGFPKRFEERTIGGDTYCVGVSTEGAAGSTYSSYEYFTEFGDSIARVAFTLRTPQCMNYDEPERSACTLEQTNFSADTLVSEIVSSIRTQ